MGYFRGWRNIRVNIAQILVIVIFLPVVAILCKVATPNSAGTSFGSFIVTLAGEVPVLNLICGLLSQYIVGFSAWDVADITTTVLLRAFPDAALVGICVHFFVQLFTFEWDILGRNLLKRERIVFKPLPIFPSFLGILAATIIVNLFDIFGNVFVALIGESITIIILIVAIRLMFGKTGRGKIFSAKKILLLAIDSIYAIIVSAYIATNVLVSTNNSGNMSETLVLLGTMISLTMISSVIVAIVHSCARKDDIV